MGIGSISSITSAISYNPYVYNTNTVSSASLNKISAISDDAIDGGIDLSDLSKADSIVNVNPLKPGETQNFADVLMNQLYSSSFRQSMVLATDPSASKQSSDFTASLVNMIE